MAKEQAKTLVTVEGAKCGFHILKIRLLQKPNLLFKFRIKSGLRTLFRPILYGK
jgi:hypothetical protein